MQAFIINLDAAADRWQAIAERFEKTRISVVRVPAVNGNALQLPTPEFHEKRFQLWHGRAINPREIGCYLSHVAAMRAFLETDDEHGLICEDDIVPGPDFQTAIESALEHARHWNVLRVSGLGTGTPLTVRSLGSTFRLCVSLGRVKGAGAYVVDRAAGRALVNGLLPMWLPFDHAIDREWRFGLKAAYVLPFPCSQTDAGFRSSIQTGNTGKEKSKTRWMTTYPYQAGNEMARWIHRSANAVRALASR